MITIDNAITKCRDIAFGDEPVLIDKEDFETIAEWLEELRRYKFTETSEQEYKRGFNNGYNKATRDFVNTCEKRLTDMILGHQGQLDFVSGLAVANRMLDDVAEKLKAGAVDG